MVSDLYVFDLETFVWERITPSPEDDIPDARYFHSTETCEFPHLANCRPALMQIGFIIREQSTDCLRWYGQHPEL